MLKIPRETDVTPLILLLVDMYKPNTYVEIGTKRGYTFNQVAPKVNNAIAIDSAGFKGVIDRPNITKIHGTSDATAETWNKSIDFLFIDGCHEKEQVLRDFKNFGKFVREGTGIICMHDTYPIDKDLMTPGYCHNAWKAAWTIRREWTFNDYEIVTLPGPFFGISIARRISVSKHFGWEK